MIKSVLTFLITFFCFVLFLQIKSVFAVSVSIKNYPQSVIAGEEFTVEAEIQNMNINTDYFLKSVGGENNYKVKTQSWVTGEWLTWNDNWDQMPKVTIATGSSTIVNLKSMFYNDISGGQNYLLKIKEPEVVSGTVSINVTLPAPTSTLTPTLTLAPTSTGTPTPTAPPAHSVSPTPRKTPTRTRTPTRPKTPTPTKKPSSPLRKTKITPTKKASRVLGAQDKTSTGSSFINSPSGEIVEMLILIGVLFGISSVGMFIYSKYQKPIDSFLKRKFKKD